MPQSYINFLTYIPDWLSVILLSALPVTELRASLPIAIFSYGMSYAQAIILVLIGNAIPILFVFLLLTPFLAWAKKHSSLIYHLLENHLQKLQLKHGPKYHRWGALFLFVFVAVPLPGSGVWTGSVLAVLFGMKPRLAVPAIVLGMVVSALVVLLLSLSVSR